MLEYHELSVVLRAHHVWKEAGTGLIASAFTTDIEKDWALLVPVLVTFPVALFEGSIVEVVEMAGQLRKCALHELINVDVRQISKVESGLGGAHYGANDKGRFHICLKKIWYLI